MKIPLGHNMYIKLHEEGNIFVFTGLIMTAVAMVLTGSVAITLVFAILTIGCFAFFRDPERVTPKANDLVISPADGIVVNIVDQLPPVELNKGNAMMTRISIFLNILNVHVNRIPMAGRITAIEYKSGKFFNASLDKASTDNERNTIVVENEFGDELVCTQIAGLVARRIVSNAEIGDVVSTGDRYGIIRFGSRVDLYIPKSYNVNILLGQSVIGGETALATVSGSNKN